MTITAWYMDEDVESDQRLPHRRDEEEVDGDFLNALGVLQWSGITVRPMLRDDNATFIHTTNWRLRISD